MVLEVSVVATGSEAEAWEAPSAVELSVAAMVVAAMEAVELADLVVPKAGPRIQAHGEEMTAVVELAAAAQAAVATVVVELVAAELVAA